MKSGKTTVHGFLGVSVNISVITFKFPIFTEVFFSPCSIFLLTCGELSRHSFLMYFYSFFAVFAFSNWSLFLTWSMFTYNLIELHLISKMPFSQNYNADQLSVQFVTSVQVTPTKIVLVDYICDKGCQSGGKFLLPAKK